jgi:hypothetical protein
MPKKKDKVNRRSLLFKFVEPPKQGVRAFLLREYVFLKRLEERYSLPFLLQLTLRTKVATLAFLLYTPHGREDLDERFKVFNWKNPKVEEWMTPELFDNPSGEDITTTRQQTLKDFIDGGKKETSPRRASRE